jgi:hypothetical protein
LISNKGLIFRLSIGQARSSQHGNIKTLHKAAAAAAAAAADERS